MSYDISIGDIEFNYTYNVSGMWYDCYKEKGIREHYGLTGKNAVPVLRKLREHMEENSKRLKTMKPDNGMGNFDGAMTFVTSMIVASLNNPDDVWIGD